MELSLSLEKVIVEGSWIFFFRKFLYSSVFVSKKEEKKLAYTTEVHDFCLLP